MSRKPSEKDIWKVKMIMKRKRLAITPCQV